jgi:hypothetical protein
MSETLKSVLFRLRNGFVAGVFGVLIASPIFTALGQGQVNLSDVKQLIFASIAGGVSGLLLAAYKYVREAWGISI